MDLSRRDYCLIGIGVVAAPVAYWAARSSPSLGATSRRGFDDYHSTLVDGLTPGLVLWRDRKWRAATGSTWNRGLDHSLRLRPERARFEIRDSELDRGPGDEPAKRRSELRFPKAPRLPNGVPLWGAMSFLHYRWDDPAGMGGKWGGVHGQLHMGSTVGGSPAVAFRRTRHGQFAVTTRGESESDSIRRYEGQLAFDRVHNLVYRVVFHPNAGALTVWLNGDAVVDLRNIPIGSSLAECYWSFGCYYAGGVSCPIVAEYGDLVYPAPEDLSRRVALRPDWGTSR